MFKYSIIIPVFNSEKYLDYCLYSIYKQSFSNFEVIIIDDGSNDNSLKIAKKYSNVDKRFKVFSQENKGVSFARNKGLELCRGDYVLFVDGDDWLPNNCLQIIDTKITETNADILCGSIDVVWPISNEHIKLNDGLFTKDNSDGLVDILYNMHEGVCSKVYKRSIIDKINLKFIDNIRNGEDSIFFHIFVSKCNSIEMCSNVLYYYNKLERNTLVSSVNVDMCDWRLIECETRCKAYEKWLNTKETINMYSCKRVFWFIDEILDYYVKHDLDYQILKSKMALFYKKYKKYIRINDNYILPISNYSIKDVVLRIEKDNYEEIYELYKQLNTGRKNILLVRIKNGINCVLAYIKKQKYINTNLIDTIISRGEIENV